MSCSVKRTALAALAAFVVALAVQAGELARPVPSNAQVTRFTKFNLRYTLRDTIADGVRMVEFYITDDMGATWRLYGEDADKTSPMTVDVSETGEGVYGFVCVATDRYGNRERAPVARTRPETVIIVDRTSPEAKWLSPLQDVVGRGQPVELGWESSDDHLAEKPVKLQYAINAQSNHDRSANWVNIQENLAADGSIQWTPEESGKYNFRLIAEDRAGNLAVAYNPATITVDNTAPTIQSVTPLRSNKLENEITVIADDAGTGVKEYSLYTSDNGAASWVLVKEAGVGGESMPVKRPSGESIVFKAERSGEYPLWPVVFDKAGNATPLPSIAVAGPFILVIDNEPPSVILSHSFLQGQMHVLVNDSRYVEWTSYDTHLEANSAAILLSLDDGKNWQEMRSGLSTSGSESVTFPFGSTSETARLKVTVRDEFGNVGEGVSEAFRLSAAETTIDSITPREPTTPSAPVYEPETPAAPAYPLPTEPTGPSIWGSSTSDGGLLPAAPTAVLPLETTTPAPLPPIGTDIFGDQQSPAATSQPNQDIYSSMRIYDESTASVIPQAKQGATPLPPASAMPGSPLPSVQPGAPAWQPSPNAMGTQPSAPTAVLPLPASTPPASTMPSPESGLPTLPAAGMPTLPPPALTPPADTPAPAPAFGLPDLSGGLPPAAPTEQPLKPPSEPTPPASAPTSTPTGSGMPQLPPLSTDGGLQLPSLEGMSLDNPFGEGSDSTPGAPSLIPGDLQLPPFPGEGSGGSLFDQPLSLPAQPDSTPAPAASPMALQPPTEPAPAPTASPLRPATGLPTPPVPPAAGAQQTDGATGLPTPVGLPTLGGDDASPALVAPPEPVGAPTQRPPNPRRESDDLVRESKRYRDDKRPDLALQSANKAREVDPDNPNANMELSQVYARMEPPDHVRAANLAVRATELQPDWETWWNCAEVYYIWAHAANREIQGMIRNGQTPPIVVVDERNSTLKNARTAINNAASVLPAGNQEAAKKIANTSGMITYLQALTVPEPVNPGVPSGPAADSYRQQQAAYKATVTPLLQEAMPYFHNARALSNTPEYNESFQLGIINFRLANLERDSGNPAQASTYYQEAIKYLDEATTARDTPPGGPREAYYMLALSHGQLADQPGANRSRHRELELRYWQQTVDFYEPGTPYHNYGIQRIDALRAEMGLGY